MEEVSSGFAGMKLVFLLSAVGGGTLFVFWMVLQFLGGFDHGGGDVDVGDVDVGGGDVDVAHGDAHGSVDPGFKVVSFQGLSSFFTMFGLVGLALSGKGTLISTGSGMVAGFIMLFAMAWLFHAFKGFQSSGTLEMKNAVGAEGTVYLKIPADGTGKAQVTVQDRMQVFDAVSDRNEEIPTGERIKVVRIVSGEKIAVVKM